ncbi:MAG TPA: hypothetical protein PKL17_06960 [Pseudomonadota bacterium]|nr:hypothetical protein [Pseudomonadota bacterium]
MTNLVVVKATPSADISTDKTMAAGSETAESAKATQRDQVGAPVHLAWREPVRGRALAWFIQAFGGVQFG